jgi:hypothetical protein
VREEITKSYREGDKFTMVHGGGNKAGRFLEVSILAEGGRKGVIRLPEGCFGMGWWRFAGELAVKSGSLDSVAQYKVGNLLGASSLGVIFGRSFVEVLRSTFEDGAKVVGGKLPYSSFLDLFPVSTCFERVSNGDGLRFAVDCYVLECMPKSLAAAAATYLKSKKMKGIFGNPRMKRLLGHVLSGLDRVLAGFASKPKCRRIRVGSLGPVASVFGRHFRSVSEVGWGHGLDLGAESGSGLISNSGLDPGSKPRLGHFSN